MIDRLLHTAFDPLIIFAGHFHGQMELLGRSVGVR